MQTHRGAHYSKSKVTDEGTNRLAWDAVLWYAYGNVAERMWETDGAANAVCTGGMLQRTGKSGRIQSVALVPAAVGAVSGH